MNFDEFFVKVFMNFMIFVELALNIGESCELLELKDLKVIFLQGVLRKTEHHPF